MKLSKSLKSIRVREGITLPHAAKTAELSKGLWSKMENNPRSNPTVNTLQKIANAFGVTFTIEPTKHQ